MVPLYARFEPATLVECEYAEATHFLYDMYAGLNLVGPLFLRAKQTTVRVTAVPFTSLNLTAFYISIRTNLQVLGPDALLKISRLQYGPTLCPYGPVNDIDNLNYAFRVKNKTQNQKNKYKELYYARPSKLKDWFEGRSEPPTTKVSARHIRHVTIHELRKKGADFFLDKCPEVFGVLMSLSHSDLHESMLAGILIWASILPSEAKAWNEVSGIWADRYHNVLDFSRKIKTEFTLRLKALQNLVPLDLTPFFELEVLVNRGVGSVDWSAERDHRIKPNVAQVPPHILKEIMLDLFHKLERMGGRPEIHSWDSFWAERWRWAPTGAFHSQYPEDLEYVPEDIGLRNKFFCFNAMPKRTFQHFYHRQPQMVAWPSKKYEWGKERAIYGVDMTNFTMSSYGMAGCEKVLEQMFPIGSSASDKNVQKTVQEVMKNGIPFCFDFEDFNSQHSNQAMDLVLATYKEVFATRLDPQQNAAIDWLRVALNDVSIKAIDGGREYKAAGTLLSGWRLTTFMNTVLNYTYTQACMQGHVLVSTHNGDDILAAVTTLEEVQRLTANALTYNIRFQKSKCFLGSVAEFLRVDHRTGVGAQYLSRAVSTFVHGPTESVLPNNLYEILNAMKTRKDELIQRKANKEIVEALFAIQLDYTAYKWRLTSQEITSILSTHLSKGGLADEYEYVNLEYDVRMVRLKNRKGSDSELITDDEFDKEQEAMLKEYGKMIEPGVSDYTYKVVKRFGLEAYTSIIKKAATHAVLARAVINRFTLSTTKGTCDQTDGLRARQYGMYRDKLAGAKVILAKTYKIPIFAVNAEITNLAQLILGSCDVMRAMELWL